MTESQWVRAFAFRMTALRSNDADPALIELLARDAYLVMGDVGPEKAAEAQFSGDQ